jgi:hypothetical protein
MYISINDKDDFLCDDKEILPKIENNNDKKIR